MRNRYDLQGIGTLSHSTPYKRRKFVFIDKRYRFARERHVNKMKKNDKRNKDDRFALLIILAKRWH